MKWLPDVGGWNLGFVLFCLVLVGLLTTGIFFGIRWLLFLPGDHGGFEPRLRWRTASFAAVGSGFCFLLVAAALHFLSLSWSESLFELFAIGLVALGLVMFLDPLFERFQETLGITGSDPPSARQASGMLMRRIAFAILLLNGVLHSLLHEFIKEYPGLSTALAVGYGPILTVITTYCWMLGWHPDPSRSRAAVRGAVIGAVAGFIVMWPWVPYLEGAAKFVPPFLGVLAMTVIPLAGGLAMDRGWGWGLGWESRPSLSMMCAMLVAWSVAGGLFWLWVFGFEKNLWHAFVTTVLPIPAPGLIIPPEPSAPVHPSFLLLSGPMGIVGWGLGLFLSRRFDRVIEQRRLQNRSQASLPGPALAR
jgi:hypothetical protein